MKPRIRPPPFHRPSIPSYLNYCHGYSQRRWESVIVNKTYEDAIELLNTFQTPYEVLKEKWRKGIKLDESANDQMRRCLSRLGISQNDLARLNIAHIAGTKGKGSTAAFTSSILTQFSHPGTQPPIPLKVGLFTSPHLISVRERIRICNTPISRELFTKYFFETYNILSSAKEPEIPVYFRFLTLMSFKVFLEEGVDAAVYETGVGGTFDSTNIIAHPAVTGLTKIGLDHIDTLGSTLESIAWHKSGIQKPNVPSFSVPQGNTGVENMIKKRASEDLALERVEYLRDEREGVLCGAKVMPDEEWQRENAGLATRLAKCVLKHLKVPIEGPARLSFEANVKRGLESVVWRGRCERKKDGNVVWFLDGAHTTDSLTVAATWFRKETNLRPEGNKKRERVLIFNQSGHREAVALLTHFYKETEKQERSSKASRIHFDEIIFCPNTQSSSSPSSNSKDFFNAALQNSEEASLILQHTLAQTWKDLVAANLETRSEDRAKELGLPETEIVVTVLSSVEDAISAVKKRSEGTEVECLVTGSVHLVGTFIGMLEGVDAV
ncbi:Mur ligase [Tricladium varicosporioides]|nr:Mur ligase [Hymenoscyphus varicosporioides]